MIVVARVDCGGVECGLFICRVEVMELCWKGYRSDGVVN